MGANTPTPWNFTDDQHGEVVIDATPQYICGVSYWDDKGPIQKGWLTQDEAKANAAFIVHAANNIERYEQFEKNLLEILASEEALVMRENKLQAEIKAFAEETRDIARAEAKP